MPSELAAFPPIINAIPLTAAMPYSPPKHPMSFVAIDFCSGATEVTGFAWFWGIDGVSLNSFCFCCSNSSAVKTPASLSSDSFFSSSAISYPFKGMPHAD